MYGRIQCCIFGHRCTFCILPHSNVLSWHNIILWTHSAAENIPSEWHRTVLYCSWTRPMRWRIHALCVSESSVCGLHAYLHVCMRLWVSGWLFILLRGCKIYKHHHNNRISSWLVMQSLWCAVERCHRNASCDWILRCQVVILVVLKWYYLYSWDIFEENIILKYRCKIMIFDFFFFSFTEESSDRFGHSRSRNSFSISRLHCHFSRVLHSS